MDSEVIEQKLEPLRRCLQRIHEKFPPSAESLAKDFDLRHRSAESNDMTFCFDFAAIAYIAPSNFWQQCISGIERRASTDAGTT